MLVLLSFIITWGEVWFFDLRMIPLERKAREMWGEQRKREEGDERTPLLGNDQSGAGGGMLQRFMEGSTLYEGSVGNFYSPFESPEVSDDEEGEEDHGSHGVKIPRRFRRKADHPFSDQVGSLRNEDLLSQLKICYSTTAWAVFYVIPDKIISD